MTSIPPIDPDRFRFDEVVPGGWNWSHVVKRGTTLRITDLAGTANVSMLMYNAEFPSERLNVPDSLKAQHTSYFTAGNTCMSDLGRVLMSVTADSCGWHDVLGGLADRAQVTEQFGQAYFSDVRNDWHRNGHDRMLVELGKWGLGPKDVVANVNFFSKVATDEDGVFSFVEDNSHPGAVVDLRSEMNTLVVLTTCPHALHPGGDYKPGDIKLEVFETDPPAEDDPCRTSCEQNGRAFLNTERYFL